MNPESQALVLTELSRSDPVATNRKLVVPGESPPPRTQKRPKIPSARRVHTKLAQEKKKRQSKKTSLLARKFLFHAPAQHSFTLPRKNRLADLQRPSLFRSTSFHSGTQHTPNFLLFHPKSDRGVSGNDFARRDQVGGCVLSAHTTCCASKTRTIIRP